MAFINILISFLLLHQYHNVKSQAPTPTPTPTAPPVPVPDFEAVEFAYESFDPNNPNIGLLGDASITNNVLILTKLDQGGTPLPNSVGRALHATPVHIWDKRSGKLADFTAGFSFAVPSPPSSSSPQGEGFTFFLAEHIHQNSTGGYLGLFDPETALDPTKNQILAFEFDTFANDWDPNYAHIGIDVGSIKSVVTAPWPSDDSVPAGKSTAVATIQYISDSKKLTFFVSYTGIQKHATVSCIVDLRTVLPEFVMVGFSATTSKVVEKHVIFNFGFENAL